MSKNSMFTKTAAVAAGFAMALSAAAPAGAVTVAELQAQIAALMAQLSSLQGGATTSTTVTFTRDLTVGSSGADVTALQQTLVAQGYLTMPAGTAFGYFGTLTKSAVARWQAAVGLPATGYFGALSRAKIGASATGTTTGGTTTGGTTTGGTTGGATGTITTPGAEGDITVTSAPVSDLTLAEGESMDPVLAFNVKAVGASDMAVQRVKLDLGNSTTIYNKILSRVYLMDDQGRTLASADLNSTNVVKDGSNYYITLSGFSSVVSRNTTRVYTVKADLRSTIDTSDVTGKSYTVRLADDGVRAVDGAGIDSYGPTTGFGVTFTVEKSQVTSAALTVSASGNTPATRQIIASAGTNKNEADNVALLNFDVKATKDTVKITSITATTTASGSNTASTTVFYLYQGSNLLGSATPSSSTGTYAVKFDNLSVMINKDATATFSISANVRNATSAATTLTTSVDADYITAENSLGDSISTSNLSGVATGNAVTILNVGPQISLTSATLTRNPAPYLGASTTANAQFKMNITAAGDVAYFGPQASSTFAFGIYKDGVKQGALLVASSSSYVVDNNGNVITSGAGITSGGFKLNQDGTASVTANFIFDATNVSLGSYAVGLESVTWSTDGSVAGQKTVNFMAGKTEWRTNTVTLP